MKRSSSTSEGGPSPAPTSGGRYRVAAAGKVLEVLDAFVSTPPPHTLASLAAATALPRPTAFRMLSTLEECGYVAKTGSAKYKLGYKCLVLGNLVEASLGLRAEAFPIMEALRDRTGETVQVAVLDSWQVVYIERVLSCQPVGYMTSRAGSILPAYCTGLGKCLLAFEPSADVLAWANTVTFPRLTPTTITCAADLLTELKAIRARGYSTDDEEREPGVACIAAPIRDARGKVVAAISAAGPANRLPRVLVDSELAQQVQAAAEAVSQRLGYLAPADGATG